MSNCIVHHLVFWGLFLSSFFITITTVIISSSIIIVIINIKFHFTSFIKMVLISTQNFFSQFSSPQGGVLGDG